MRSFFLAIEGAIGVGKTTLARLLQPRFEAGLLLEAFEDNPFLADFYADRARYAFQTQMVFLLSRYQQQQTIASGLASKPLIADYFFAKDSLFAQLNLEGDEWAVYKRLYDVLADRIAVPDLVVYLRADIDVLMARIATRDRAYERNMDRSYINRLRQAYARYFSDYAQAPLLTIDTDDLNYVQDPDALTYVESQIRTALGIGAYQQSLPQMEPGGIAQLKTVPIEPGQASAQWNLVEEFMAANASVGRVGTALAVSEASPGAPGAEVKAALQDALERLKRLAYAVGLDPREFSHR